MKLVAWSALLCACSGALVVAGRRCSCRCVALFVYTVSFGAFLLTARPLLLDFISPLPPILPPAPPVLPIVAAPAPEGAPQPRGAGARVVANQVVRNVGTQSQTTYTLHNRVPRFRVLPTHGQGAFV